jgi:UDP-N-acetylglucosamine--dolichyl-phosphate N-acetylglucosaminephosphotransferase
VPDALKYPASAYAPPELTDLLSILLVAILAYVITHVILPPLMRKMREGGMEGRDVNKRARPRVPELGGIAALFAFAISLSLVLGVKKYLEPGPDEPPYLAAIAVFFIAAMIGLIDDISNLKQRVKAGSVLFAALPLVLVHFRDGTYVTSEVFISYLPFGLAPIDLRAVYLPFWLILVPAGVTGVANAMNMSAGYNGLESGQIAVVGGSLLVVLLLLPANPDGAVVSSLVLAGVVGSALGLFWFNRYPARVFVGDIGTLGLGAALAAGIILGGIEIYGLLAIAPAYYEAAATFYYTFVRPAPDRRRACHNPVIRADGRLSPPAGAERYTLAYLLLSRRPMTEPRLVATILALYAISGLAAMALAVL